MLVSFPYGEKSVVVELPDEQTKILSSREIPTFKNVEKEIVKRLEKPIAAPPLSSIVKKISKILIVIPDITRACPTKKIIEPLLELIERSSPAEVNILVANGLHRSITDKEIIELVGSKIAKEYQVINHVATDEAQLIRLGGHTAYGTPLVVNKLVIESDLVIGIGLIEPHFVAGYSGGRKILLPGVAGAEAIFNNHSYKMIDHPNSRVGILDGNPMHEDMMEFMKRTKLDFIVNVIINKDKKISGIFAGNPVEAHLAGIRELEKYVKVRYDRPSDIVITTNGGYPLDRDVYQTVKGMDTAAMVVRDGGVIIMVAECRDGLGGHEEFVRLVEGTNTPKEILERVRRAEPVYDQWQAQLLARVLKKAKVIMVTEGEKPNTLKKLQLDWAASLEDALELAKNIVGKTPTITAIPEGPYIIPTIK